VFKAVINLKDIPTVMDVVAAALLDGAGRLLLQQRPAGKHHAGLWEFPGGKVEPGETLEKALIREIEEELGLLLEGGGLSLAASARQAAAPQQRALVLFLYTATIWAGEPVGHEGQEWGWFAPPEAVELPLAPLDRELLREIAKTLR